MGEINACLSYGDSSVAIGLSQKWSQDISQYHDATQEHLTGRLWVDCLIRLTLSAHQLERAERDCDKPLQLHYYQQMLPYFFAAGHWQYARYITWHVIKMQHMLPDDAKMDLLADAHVCRHRPGTWNSMSAHQFGEQTYTKKGKVSGWLKGLTMSEDQVAIWVESYHICAHVTLAIDSMFSVDDEVTEEKRKEEGEKRRILDTGDRNRVYEELKKHSHPLKLTSSSLCNIINGQVANASLNVQETLKMGESMLLDFRSSLPGGFHAPLKRKVKTMESIKCGGR